MIVGYVQTSPGFGKRERNFQEVLELTQGVKADLLVLPELFATGYAFTSREEALSLGEGTDGPTAAFLQSLAAGIGGAVAAGFPEKAGHRLYNAAMLVNSTGVLAVYRKIHLFAREKFVFDPGDRPFAVYPLPSCKIGLMICFDWAFPEAARSLALQGAQVIAHPANLVTPYCQEAMRTRCLENRLFAVTANRVGSENRGEQNLTFTGMSQVTGCKGEVLHRGRGGEPEVRLVELDPAAASDKKLTAFNHLLDDRRPELYLT